MIVPINVVNFVAIDAHLGAPKGKWSPNVVPYLTHVTRSGFATFNMNLCLTNLQRALTFFASLLKKGKRMSSCQLDL